jgi:hypothetical protein
MKSTIYLETSFISHLAARPSADVMRQAQQKVTQQWWRDRRFDFSLYVSQFVLDEAAAGDPKAAAERLAILNRIQLLEIAPDVEPLARRLLDDGALPPKARIDALHLAVATVNGLQYLMTWNCKHLANAALGGTIERTCRQGGYQPPGDLHAQ